MIKVLAAEPRSKKRSGDEAFEISRGSAANSYSTGTAAPPPNLLRLVHNTTSYAGYFVGNLHFTMLISWIVIRTES